MISNTRHWLWAAALLPSMGIPLNAAEFAPPAEGPVAFRRDKVPLDADAMAGLSRQLETLARGLDAGTPAELRAAAQMLALSLALDPANSRARELVSEYQTGNHKPSADPDKIEKGRARIWQYIAWLETPDAGNQGQALAACLKDVIVVSDPKNPKSGELRNAGEKGAWAGWVPAISAYESNAIASNQGSETPLPEPKPVPVKNTFLEEAQVHTLLWQSVGKGDAATWILAPAPLQMTAQKVTSEDPDNEPKISVSIGSGENAASLEPISQAITSLLRKQHEKLPHGLKISINSKELETSLASSKRQSISAAAAVLASSAVTGREPDALIIGQVDETGAFKLPTGFWDQLQALNKGNGKRLVLPMEAASYLPSILALEKPEFFMEFEVVLAADFKQLLELSAKTPEGPLATATAEFRKIRERIGAQDVRQYIANIFVKQRLIAVLQEAPYHVSAKMLVIQASGNRPTLVVSQVLVAEIRRALAPMVWVTKIKEDGLDASTVNKIGQVYDLCRPRIDALERYAEKNDRPLIEQARELLTAVRNIDRATRTRGEDQVVKQAIQRALGDLNRLAASYNEALSTAAGEAPPPPNP